VIWFISLTLRFDIIDERGARVVVEMGPHPAGVDVLAFGWLAVLCGWSVGWLANIPFMICTFQLSRGRTPSLVVAAIGVGLAFSVLLGFHDASSQVAHFTGPAVVAWLAGYAVMGLYTLWLKL
jgi:hypothetical protein